MLQSKILQLVVKGLCCEMIIHTFKVSESVALQLVSIKYCRLALMLLFFCFFLNSSKANAKKKYG